MTFHEKRIAKKITKKIIKETVKRWVHNGNFDEWFWDSVNDGYTLREDEIDYITKNLKKWVDK